MRSMFGAAGLLATVLLTACGTPQAGEECDSSGFLCENRTSALECRVGTWTSLPCRGPAGCELEGDTVTCDMTLNQEGDACAASAEGKGLCTSTGDGTLECRQGKFVRTNNCSSCSVVGDQVVCQR